MKILQLCNKPPLPTVDGGCLAMNALSQGFINHGHEVKILSVHTLKHPFVEEKLDPAYLKKTRWESLFIDTTVNLVDAFSNLLTQDSYNISRFFSPDFDMHLKHILQREKFDIIQFESLFMTPYLSTAKRYSKAKCVLRSHNLEYIIWKRIADGTRNKAKKFYLKHLAKKLELYELDIIKRVDAIVTISNDDYAKYSELQAEKSKLINIPFGIDVDSYELPKHSGELALFHLGSLEWKPNLEGVTWFLHKIWPTIQQQFPDLKFYLAGRHIPVEFSDDAYRNVEVVGEVPDAKEFISSKAIMLVPILSAGGMRVKIIEGLALGKTILSTTVGAEGIDFEKDKHIYLANSKKEFLKVISKWMENPKALEEQMNVSRNYVKQHFDNAELTSKLLSFYNSIVQVSA
ncbi:MAG: glycosyltransferase family 4 protein [Flavobacteriales bacterium]